MARMAQATPRRWVADPRAEGKAEGEAMGVAQDERDSICRLAPARFEALGRRWPFGRGIRRTRARVVREAERGRPLACSRPLPIAQTSFSPRPALRADVSAA